MRLNKEHINLLKDQILAIRPEADIFLFGSRVDDNKRGGDIDILILSEERLTIEESLSIERGYGDKFGHQKIDLVCFKKDDNHPFKQVALFKSIPL